MGPKDPSQISMAVIEAVLDPRLTEDEFYALGMNLRDFLDKGADNLSRVCERATRVKLLAALKTHIRDRATKGLQTSDLQALYFLKRHISHALLSTIGSLFGVDTVEPNSTNPFSSAVASVVNAELRRIWQELYLGSLDTPGEELLHLTMVNLQAIKDAGLPVAVDHLLIRYHAVKEEAANASA